MIYLTGFLMALADSVPGVSGSTIAFILGQYDNFIFHLHNLKSAERKESINYLTKLGSTWIIGFITAILLVGSLIENNIYLTSSLFIGFIVAVIPLTIIREQIYQSLNFRNLLILIISVIFVVALSYLGIHSELFSSTETLTPLNMFFLVASGFFAISAMLLPGISGSTVLTIFGVYFLVIEAIKETLTFNFQLSNFVIITLVGLGIIIGFFTVPKYINYLFKNHRVAVISSIIGLMIGSIYSLILAPLSIDSTASILNFSNFNFGAFIVGIFLILTLEFLNLKRAK